MLIFNGYTFLEAVAVLNVVLQVFGDKPKTGLIEILMLFILLPSNKDFPI